MLQNHCKGTDFSPNNQKKTQKKITNLMIFLDSDCLLQVCLSYISVNVATFLIQPIPLYILWINKEYIPQIDIQPIFKCDFCSFLAKITLKPNFNTFFAYSLLYECSRTFLSCFQTPFRTTCQEWFTLNFCQNWHFFNLASDYYLVI